MKEILKVCTISCLVLLTGCEEKTRDDAIKTANDAIEITKRASMEAYNSAKDNSVISANYIVDKSREVLNLDSVINKLSAVGIPALVIIAAAGNGVAGGAVIVSGLFTMGGPLGMVGGVAALALLALAGDAISQYGFEVIGEKTVEKLLQEGHTPDEIRREIDSYPISDSLKAKIQSFVK